MNEATRRQIEAASPGRSTWLSANAGSGKTRVLTDRVARLLLGGVSPQNILCLTYTKAAASEMQNRLFKRLGAWAMLPDEALRTNLRELGVEGRPDLSEARRLFAKSVETPGGLRIQTIHSFCAILLRRFPVEAGVSPQFTEMDDRSAELLRDICLEQMAETDPDLVGDMARALGGGDIRPLLGALTGARDDFRTPLTEPALRALLDARDAQTLDDLVRGVFADDGPALLNRVARIMASHGGVTDQKNAPKLAAASAASAQNLVTLEGLLLYGSDTKSPFGSKAGAFPSKAARAALDPDDAAALDALMDRIEYSRQLRLALVELERNLVLQRFARAYLPIYAQAKADRGWLDFDDLILKARDLLTTREVAEWVLYRLDGGIDHILVDEAQDTSPQQWEMIDALAREVAAGDGTRAVGERTIFVVGDKKQSIYSFQGADPAGFDRMYQRFSERLGPDNLQRLEMLHSFRSAHAILNTVDTTFVAQDMAHIAFHDDLPGRVDLWPLIEPEDAPDTGDFDDPVDLVSPTDAAVRLAGQIAHQIRHMIETQTIPDPDAPGESRQIHAGDVLILFRSRKVLFDAVIRACKAMDIPMAGADRLTLTSELAVKDITALLSFLSTPEDSLSLAAALKSPLFGWDEQALFDLAARRTERHLWQALRRRQSEYPQTMAILNDLRGQADFLRPYDLIERLLTRHRGRALLVGRLGSECEEAIDALLAQALIYERTSVPSLTGFLSWLTGDEIQIKRQSESAGRNLRIMTIHGAKGLEAPIVILPETMAEPPKVKSLLWPVPGGRVLKQNKDALPTVLEDARDAIEAAQEAERDRLLYVAMTRAQFWLILCGAGQPKQAEKRWYGQMQDAFADLPCASIESPIGTIQRYQTRAWDALTPVSRPTGDASVSATDLPAWIDRDVARPPVQDPWLRPSDLGGAKVLPGDIVAPADLDDALLRGSQLHALLEHLPPDAPDSWDALSHRLLAALDDTARTERLDEARRVLSAPTLRPLFTPNALVEIPIVARHPSGRSIVGTIDRLIVEDERVLAVDYKSNRMVPDSPDTVPEGLLRQMGAYDAALAQIYPGKRIETALLWTATATLMMLPADMVQAAFARATDLDG
ncbi:double-strand break repair helicase AddA [Maribius pontilimi]|uniref:DNA 3'-5' helicase n=1 Tax=Palleronia pontilimi TaxID=1964209 RepID=A0A934I788_9RHOB|nr:double-strand break repair helicase AddA [Palleronia pontilimi]MBJ3761528.1 double-strand break repair helicase AddA [Palleronia pontilimi]